MPRHCGQTTQLGFPPFSSSPVTIVPSSGVPVSDPLLVHPPKLVAVELRGASNFCASWDVFESEENVIVNNYTWTAGTNHSVLDKQSP